ncbi:MAG: putative sulfate exporter family transporter [Alistipes sp.]|nr:putative sulfate exporter family transporter [Alistipes sp.]MBQ7342336.1 putative sulfate exporter family transporter [Alistipes sp.]
MKKFLEQFKTEDWVVTFLSIPLLILAGCASFLNGGPKIPTDLTTAKAWIDIAALFVIAIVILYAGNRLLSRPMKGMFWSFVVIFIIAALAMWIGSNPYIKSELGLEPVFFSVIFGLIIRNCFHIPEWLKPAIQGEFFIKTGVVCLGATIMISDVLKSGAVGLLQACVVVTVVWFFAYLISRKLFKVEQATAMTLSSGVTICGVSACITAAGVAGTDKKSLSYIVSVVLIIVVPMIYLMPWLANTIVPLLTSDPQIQQEIAGAWIGGTIDTTSGVAASSEMAGEIANRTAIVVKATQNVLIGVVAFFIALYLSTKSEGGGKQRPSLKIVWDKFPKFILAFVVASLVFSLLKEADLFTLNAKGKLMETSFAKTLSTLFFSLAFVCIGMDTRLKDIISKENRNVLYAFLTAQTFNICITFLIAWLLFGVVKPLMA